MNNHKLIVKDIDLSYIQVIENRIKKNTKLIKHITTLLQNRKEKKYMYEKDLISNNNIKSHFIWYWKTWDD